MLNPERTLAIVCGAKEWPNLDSFEAAPAFANSAELIRGYLTGKKGLRLATDRILWLFDKQGAASQYQLITDFLQRQFEALHSARGKGVLILFFYVGHGAFFGPSRDYCLLVQDTRRPLEADTSLRVASLARLFRSQAPESSRILFLDCCFAGEAARLFQGGLDQAVSTKAHEVVEEAPTDRGVALLCASSARNPANMESPTSYTFFGHELIQVLTKGDPDISGSLTLRQLCELVRYGLRRVGGDGAPNPEVHVPDQVGGDLAAVPLFPNPARAEEQGLPGLHGREGPPDNVDYENVDSPRISEPGSGQGERKHLGPSGMGSPQVHGAGGAMGDLRLSGSERREFLSALCDAFYTKSRIDGVLDDLGFPPGRRPPKDGTIEDAWRAVFHELDAGRLEDGYRALLELVLERFGFNQTFVRLAERHGITC